MIDPNRRSFLAMLGAGLASLSAWLARPAEANYVDDKLHPRIHWHPFSSWPQSWNADTCREVLISYSGHVTLQHVGGHFSASCKESLYDYLKKSLVVTHWAEKPEPVIPVKPAGDSAREWSENWDRSKGQYGNRLWGPT